jgi:hypothetical protein
LIWIPIVVVPADNSYAAAVVVVGIENTIQIDHMMTISHSS